MMGATNHTTNGQPNGVLATALKLLSEGFWPLPITTHGDRREWVRSPGKQPAEGKGWGKIRPTEASLRAFFHANPKCGLGLKLGKAAGLIDLEVDDPETGEATLQALFSGDILATRGWLASRGRHLGYRWDDRLAAFGSVIENDPRFPGLGLRFGSADDSEASQIQSVCPPSPITIQSESGPTAGSPREWNGVEEVAQLPECFFENVARRLLEPPISNPSPTGPRPGPGCVVPPIPAPTALDAEQRAIAYLAACPPAISGQGGHDTTFGVICRVGPGFNLPKDVAARILNDHYNPKCVPKWSEKEIAHKVEDAYAKEPRRGWLLAQSSLSYHNHASTNGVLSVSSVSSTMDTFSEPEWEPPVEREKVCPIPFPLEVFPEPLRELCLAGSASIQAPVDYFGAAALGLAGGVIGRSVALRVSTTWEASPNLFVAIVGPAGTKKSPALKLMAKPLFGIDADLRAIYRAAKETWNKQDKDERGDPPTFTHLTLDDTTREAYAKALNDSPRGLVLIKDELTSWVASLNAYRGGKGDDKQFWMGINSCSRVKVTRKGTPEPLVINHPCGAVVGCLTPSTLPSLRDGQADDGWLDRLLFAFPDRVARARTWRREQVPEELIQEWTDAIARLWARQMIIDPQHSDDRTKDRPYYIHFTEAADKAWEALYNAHQIEQCQEDFPSNLIGPWSKLEGFTLRFALILSQLHQAYDPIDDSPPANVTADDVAGAKALLDYFKCHFRRAREELMPRFGVVDEDAAAVLRWLRAERKETFTAHDLTRRFRSFSESDRSDVINTLVAYRFIRPIKKQSQPQGGRPSHGYEVNPFFVSTWDKTETTDKTPSVDAGEEATPPVGDPEIEAAEDFNEVPF